jgi:hypothetical protein
MKVIASILMGELIDVKLTAMYDCVTRHVKHNNLKQLKDVLDLTINAVEAENFSPPKPKVTKPRVKKTGKLVTTPVSAPAEVVPGRSLAESILAGAKVQLPSL